MLQLPKLPRDMYNNLNAVIVYLFFCQKTSVFVKTGQKNLQNAERMLIIYKKLSNHKL